MQRPAIFLLSAVATILITSVIIVAHEISKEFRQSLMDLTGHHWVSVSAIAMILFLLFAILLLVSERASKALRADDLGLWSKALVAATLVAILGSLTVYITHYLAA